MDQKLMYYLHVNAQNAWQILMTQKPLEKQAINLFFVFLLLQAAFKFHVLYTNLFESIMLQPPVHSTLHKQHHILVQWSFNLSRVPDFQCFLSMFSRRKLHSKFSRI
jgi:hypothetical protein